MVGRALLLRSIINFIEANFVLKIQPPPLWDGDNSNHQGGKGKVRQCGLRDSFFQQTFGKSRCRGAHYEGIMGTFSSAVLKPAGLRQKAAVLSIRVFSKHFRLGL